LSFRSISSLFPGWSKGDLVSHPVELDLDCPACTEIKRKVRRSAMDEY
jgi:hypothetical protein